MSKKFTYTRWDFDLEGEAYVVAKSYCPDKDKVAAMLCREDCLSADCIPDIEQTVEEGWASWQIRSDWDGHWGKPMGWYRVERCSGKPERGKWFPVWIIRIGEWY